MDDHRLQPRGRRGRRRARRDRFAVSAGSLAALGFGAFALASVGCAAATSFGLLVGFRAVQGAAAALVLVAALPLLGGRAGVRAWVTAATIGFAAGPGLGGLLTEFFSWRSIFIAQAPLVAGGLLALRGLRVAEEAKGGKRPPRAWLADATLGAISAALVGALFLVVVLLVNGYGWQPLPAALVATTLPVLAGVAERIGRGLPPLPAAASGGIADRPGPRRAGSPPRPADEPDRGRASPSAAPGSASPPSRSDVSRWPASTLAREAAWTVVARHAGLVAALVVVTPVLVSTLTELETDAEAVGGDLVLESRLPLADKVPAFLDLAESADRAEASVPDVEAVLEPYETGSGAVRTSAAASRASSTSPRHPCLPRALPRLRLLRAPRRAPGARA